MERTAADTQNVSIGSRDVWTEMLRQGPQNLLATAIENEVAETRRQAQQVLDRFIATFEAKYPKAVECLANDREVLLAVYDVPAEHWVHLRTTHPMESTFATVRLRTARTKGCGSRTACLTMAFKPARCVERHWRRLNGSQRPAEVITGVAFVDGTRQVAA